MSGMASIGKELDQGARTQLAGQYSIDATPKAISGISSRGPSRALIRSPIRVAKSAMKATVIGKRSQESVASEGQA